MKNIPYDVPDYLLSDNEKEYYASKTDLSSNSDNNDKDDALNICLVIL